MRTLSSVLLAGVAVAGLALAVPSLAGELHRLTVALPGGGSEVIEYSGNVPPRVHFTPVMIRAEPAFDPWASSFLWRTGFGMPPFAAFDRFAAQMDARMDAMMRQAEFLTRQPLTDAMLKDLPAGATSFSIVARSTGNGMCTQVTKIVQGGADAKPQVVSESHGDCGAAGHQAVQPSSDMRQINYRLPATAPARHPL